MSIRGTQDLFGRKYQIYKDIREKFSTIAEQYSAQFIQTSALDSAELFVRTAGADSDICQKEMFTVSYKCADQSEDKDKEVLTILKPEGTAPAIRALYESNFIFRNFEACAYFDRMYRYSRPQRGRLREFNQAGIEFFGESPLIDFQALESAVRFIDSLGLLDQVTLKINTLGKAYARQKFVEKLDEYFKANSNKISIQHANPLRILDKLSDEEKQALSDMPKLYDMLPGEDKEYFDTVLKYLDKANIRYEVDPTIIRGLDYYAHTVFEFCTSATTAQNTVLAGGRYDQLIRQITEKQDCSAIGWGAGVERLMLLLDDDWNSHINDNIYVLSLNEDEYALGLASTLRAIGQKVKFFTNIKFDKFLSRANQDLVGKVIICGSEEREKNNFLYKDMYAKTQQNCSFEELLELL